MISSFRRQEFNLLSGSVVLNTRLLPILLALIVSSLYCYAYTPLNEEQRSVVLPYTTRFATSLSGEWERTTENNEWSKVTLPSSETSIGKVTYRKQVTIEPNMLNKYLWHLQFLGLSDVVEITVNNQYVGRYFGGMVPFMIRLPERVLKAGSNTIQLDVSPASNEAMQMRRLNLFGQRAYTGVIRELFLVGTPHVMIGNVRTSSAFSGSDIDFSIFTNIITGNTSKITAANDSVSTPININKSSLVVTAELKVSATGVTIGTDSRQFDMLSDRTNDVSFGFRISNPSLWSPSDPNLYTLSIKVSVGGQTIDEYSSETGLVTITKSTAQSQSLITLNGQPYFIKAIEYIEESPKEGATVNTDLLERDVQLMKTLGINTVRVRYFAPHPYFVYLCNRYGLLIIADFPVYDVPASLMQTDEVNGRMKNMAERMTTAYQHHPSIAGWNISEGLQQSQQATQNFMNYIAGLLRKTSNLPLFTTIKFREKTLATDMVDGILFTNDRFDMTNDAIVNELKRLSAMANKPFAFCFGKPVNPDNRNGYADPISLEAQAKYIESCYKALKYVQGGGVFVWSFSDYALNRSTILTNTSGQYYCYSGLVNLQRQKRASFDMYKALLNDEKDILLQAGNYNESTPYIYIIAGILLIVVLTLIMNQSRRFREYFLRALIYPYNFYADIRDQRILSKQQTAVLGFVISTTLGIFVSTLLFTTRMSSIAEYVVMLLFPQEGLKGFVSGLAWSPELGVIVLTLLFFILLIIISLILRVGAFFVRGRIFYSDTFIITVWSALPFVLFLPFATILFRLLDITTVTLWVIILAGFAVWVLYRILRATSVVFDVNPIPVYGVGLSIIAIIITTLALSYNSSYSIFAYTQYFLNCVL